MLELIIFYMALLCTNPTPHTPGEKCNGIHIMAKDDGETGDIKPPLPPPPPIPPRP